MPLPIKIGLTTQSGDVPYRDLPRVAAAIQLQVSRDVAGPWQLPPVVVAAFPKPAAVPAGFWHVTVRGSRKGDGNWLGYHSDTKTNQPLAWVLAEDGWEMTASHEILEMVVDPFGNRMMVGPHPKTQGVLAHYLVEACLAAETRIPLADGTRPTIEQLASRPRDCFAVWAHSVNGPRWAKAVRPRLTQRRALVVRIVFSDGTSVRCTPDHRFLTTTGAFVEARDLHPGSLLLASGEPSPTLADPVDAAHVAVEPLSQDARRFSAGTDGFNVGPGELRVPVALAAQVAVPGHSALGGSIVHVVPMRSQEQVRRVDAGGRVARVADKQAIGDRSLVHLEGDPVGVVSAPTEPHLTVSQVLAGSSPEPAIIRSGLRYSRPEGCFARGSAAVVGPDAGMDISMVPLATPVGRAQSLRAQGARASLNGAFHNKSVSRIEPGGHSDVYDLTVPGCANFAVEAGVFAHNCDPCEAFSYQVGGVNVSDFILPAFYADRVQPHTRYSFLGKLPGPRTIAPGGYLSFFVDGQGWYQEEAFSGGDGTIHKLGARRAGVPLRAWLDSEARRLCREAKGA